MRDDLVYILLNKEDSTAKNFHFYSFYYPSPITILCKKLGKIPMIFFCYFILHFCNRRKQFFKQIKTFTIM